MTNKIIILFGVSGCGKSTVGKALSEKTGIPFFDADDFHPVANVEKMKTGSPLNDEDRLPWLLRLNELLVEQEGQGGAVLACSALKESYRVLLAKGLSEAPIWGYLKGSFELIYGRLASRSDHFMPTDLLQSQFDTLEVPAYAVVLDIAESVPAIIGKIWQVYRSSWHFLALKGRHILAYGVAVRNYMPSHGSAIYRNLFRNHNPDGYLRVLTATP